MNIADLLLSTLPSFPKAGVPSELNTEGEGQFDVFMAETSIADTPVETEQEIVAEIAPVIIEPQETEYVTQDISQDTDVFAATEQIQTEPPQTGMTSTAVAMNFIPVNSEPAVARKVATSSTESHTKTVTAPTVPAEALLSPATTMSITPGSKEAFTEAPTNNVSIVESGREYVRVPRHDINMPQPSLPTREPVHSTASSAAAPVAAPASMYLSSNATQDNVDLLQIQPMEVDHKTNMPAAAFAHSTGFSPSAAAGSPATPVINVAQTPTQQVVRQISNIVATMSDGNVEIRLDPPELGRLVVSITQTDTAVNAHITADKPEMLEFLRRNADVFSRELARQGFNNASLEFSYNEQQKPETDSSEDPSSSDEYVTTQVNDTTTINIQSDGLDIRL